MKLSEYGCVFLAAAKLELSDPITLYLEDGAEVDDDTYEEFDTKHGYTLHVNTGSLTDAVSSTQLPR